VSHPVRVVIADDHPMFRYGLQAVLAASTEVEVVGEAADGAALVAAVEQLRPDVVLTDLAMPGVGGASAAAQILQRFPDTGVLILTMHEDDEALFEAMRAGAQGYTCSRVPTATRSCVPCSPSQPATRCTALPSPGASSRS